MPFLAAATENALTIARLLLDHGADANAYFMAGASRYPPLVGVIGEGEEDRPITSGSRSSTTISRSPNGCSHTARAPTRRPRLTRTGRRSRGATIELENDEHQRPLHAAAWSDAIAVAQLLIDRGAEIDLVETSCHNTPLEFAVH